MNRTEKWREAASVLLIVMTLGTGVCVWDAVKTVKMYAHQAEAPIVGQCNTNGQCWDGTRWFPKPRPKEPYHTSQWQLQWMPGLDNRETDEPSRRFRVDVIDTEGVCLYVVQGYHRVDNGISNPTSAIGVTAAITAVPKTQLRAGVGCQ